MSLRAAAGLAVLALAAGGCVADGGSLGPYAPTAQVRSGYSSAQLARPVGAEAALARLPAQAGAVLAVVERRSAGIVAQDIALYAEPPLDGENRIILAIGPGYSGGGVLGPRLGPATAAEISAELAKEFSGLPMRISATGGRNPYGPFGYASGAGAGRACVYAWQFIPQAGVFTRRPGLLGGSDAVALRIRLCSAKRSAEALAADVQGLMLAVPVAGAAPAAFAPTPSGGDALDYAASIY